MTNKDCPSCTSRNTKKCEIVYEQGVSTIYGPNFDTTRVSQMADRVSPPVPPINPAFWRNRLLKFGAGAAFFILIGLFISFFWAINGNLEKAFGGIPPLGIGAFILWHGWPPKGVLDHAKYEAEQRDYESNLALYRRLWVCLDCGEIYKERTV